MLGRCVADAQMSTHQVAYIDMIGLPEFQNVFQIIFDPRFRLILAKAPLIM